MMDVKLSNNNFILLHILSVILSSTWFSLSLSILILFNLNQFTTINAYPPIIHYSHIMRILKIPYTTEPGSVVYRIKASDADNDDVIFDVLEDYGKSLIRFDKINQNEANVVLMCPLKKNDEYNLTIYANSNDESTYIESRLIATDIGERTPAKLRQINPFIIEVDPVYVYENVSLNHSIAVVKAYEQDDSELPVTFELLENNENMFHFRYIFGPRGMSVAEIILLNPLDYEQQNLYVLKLLAINGKTIPEIDTRNVHQTQLTIVVKDIQDTAPKFLNLPQACFINDQHGPNETIFVVNAQDGDVTNKRNVTFNIKKPNDKYFNIHSNGSLYSLLTFDQLNEIYDVRSPILLDIEANEIVKRSIDTPSLPMADPTISSTSQLILVFDPNNRVPQFSHREYIGHINEHSPYLTSVQWHPSIEPYVYDSDYGFNGTFELEIIDQTNTFIVAPTNGYRNLSFTLLVNNSETLDFEKYNNLIVTIHVKDLSQKQPLTNNVTCTIYINDINDNYPEFSENNYHSSIRENAPVGTIVTTLKTNDKDSGNYGQVRFTGLKGPYAQNFQIDPLTGVVKLMNNEILDREMIEELFVTVEARDDLGNGNLNSTELYIQILDVNDNPPLFLQSHYVAILNNDLMDFIHPLKVDAIDIDQINTTNSMVNYEILQGNYENMFIIDKLTGNVHVKRNTEVSSQLKNNNGNNIPNNLISLTVRAYDLGIPQMSSLAKVYIYILNKLTVLPTLFSTSQILDIRNGNHSLEKTLSMITGGNVTVKELRSPKSPNDPVTIVTMVKYQNENIIDLDNLGSAYENLFYNVHSTTNREQASPGRIGSTINNINNQQRINKTRINSNQVFAGSSSSQEKVSGQTHSNDYYQDDTSTRFDGTLSSSRVGQLEGSSSSSRFGQGGLSSLSGTEFTSRNLRTSGSNSLLNWLMYLLLALILLLLIFLLCLCCFWYRPSFCCRRDSKTEIEQKNLWYTQKTKKNAIRPNNIYGDPPSSYYSSSQHSHNKRHKKRRVRHEQHSNKMLSTVHRQHQENQTSGHESDDDDDHHHSMDRNKKMITTANQMAQTSTLSHHHQNDWFQQSVEHRFQTPADGATEIEYEIKEEKKYTTMANSPKTMSYYMCKKIIRPKLNETRQVDILNLENGETHRLFHRKKISTQQHQNLLTDGEQEATSNNKLRSDLTNRNQLTFDDIENQQEKEEPHHHNENQTKNEHFNEERDKQNKELLLTQSNNNQQFINKTKNQHKIFGTYSKNSTSNCNNNFLSLGPISKCNNIQRKSIFSICYDGITNRENFSSESDKTLYEYH